MRRLLPRSPGARAAVAVVAFFVVLNVVVLAVTTFAPEPGGEVGSAYATQPRGAAAYAELLRRAGHRVTYVRKQLDAADLDPAATIVVLDAPDLQGAERAALARFVREGGRLVAGGADPGEGVVQRPPRWSSSGPRRASPSLPLPETSAVRSVASAGDGGFDEPGETLLALGGRRALLAIAASGNGRALLLADASPLQNRLLAQADNAALGLALAGPPRRPVAFVESIHGFGEQTGLAALPARWRMALIFAGIAALLWMASRGRRLGPPEDTGGEPPPARREHVEALALALKRSNEPAVALEPVQAAARAQVVRRASLQPDAPDAAVREAALGLGFGEDEAAALIGERSSHTALALGRALAKGRA
ncbi:MAG: hypothetical protein QOE31_661 [Solirubrobacteraceae bacterium]|nr:hypothetical protein [Solirubrobacteraceae bacterium]